MQKVSIDELRTKYLNMAKALGIDETITALHNEMGNLEGQMYDDGFQEERLEIVQKLRELSREIWTSKFKL